MEKLKFGDIYVFVHAALLRAVLCQTPNMSEKFVSH